MQYVDIEKHNWAAFFRMMDQVMKGTKIELEIAALDTGDQIEVDWMAFDGLTYDPRADQITVFAGESSHSIDRPTEVVAGEDGTFLRTLSVRDCIGRIQIVRFREPLMLMPPLPRVS